MVVQYKCPSCGSDYAYNIEEDCLLCPHCGSKSRIQDMPFPEGAMGDTASEQPEVTCFEEAHVPTQQEYHYQDDGTHESEGFSEDIAEYHCKNCGAIVVTDKNTAATWCHYCDSPVVLSDRLSGQIAPVYVIPFKVTKEKAEQAFFKWCKTGIFTPKKFKQLSKVKSVSGIYVPFWLFDMSTRGDVDMTCTKSTSYSKGNYIYTQTSYFHVYRRAALQYLRIPADGSQRMDDKVMDLLEPFYYEEMQKFQMPYLAGYFAEKYDRTDADLLPRVKERVTAYTRQYLKESVRGYSTTKCNRESYYAEEKHADYTLFPVWMFSYDYEDSEHMFVMNGQTGKIVGKQPVSKGKVFAWWGLITMVIFLILLVLSLL